MQIYVAQLNPVIGAIKENTKKIIEAIKEAKAAGCELVIFSEMVLPGYFPDDLLYEPGFIELCSLALDEIIPHTQAIAAIIGTVRKNEQLPGKPFRNCAAVVENGRLLGFQDKTLLPTYDIFDEARYMEPAATHFIWNLCQKNVAITVCEDIWHGKEGFLESLYPIDPLLNYEKKPLDLLVNISASPYCLGKIQVRQALAKQIACRMHCPVVLVNQIGAQDAIVYDGSSLFVTKTGDISASAPSFKEGFMVCGGDVKGSIAPAMVTGQELFEALVLGVRDYFFKQGIKKACLGLSGGIDSAVVACIAAEALGPENILALLLPSRFTQARSVTDAEALAKRLSIQTRKLSIEAPFKAFLDTLSPVVGNEPFGISEENIQARVRAVMLMAVSNKEGYLLLNTSNKSEAAMGYTTLYGDACGAISVLGDLLKGQVYEVADWINQRPGVQGVIGQEIIDRAPSAELRDGQKDSDTLPEYSLLDVVVEELVVNRKSPDEIVAVHGFDSAVVNRIAKAIYQNEYKRRQLPFSLRVSSKAFSIGRKMPIVHHFFLENRK